MDNNNYAGFWTRWFAQGVDMAVWSLNFFIALFLLSAYGSTGVEVFAPNLLWFFLYVILFSKIILTFFHAHLIHKFGGGVGKLVCGLKIINLDGKYLTFKNALFREYIAKIASNALLGIGYYGIYKTAQKQAWHDSLSGTYVVKKHNGIPAGIMVMILVTAIEAGLVYQTYNNFLNNGTLQYDIATLATQIQQDINQSTHE